ncbi:MAG TPA: response regulator [Terrimesophilobacter sp.]|nr:response regulator [Terrimesophilobacter sp.]
MADGAPLRVVAADDDDDIRALVAIAVERAGLDLVASAADGDAAWEAIRTTVPHIAILDVSMPGKSGLDLCQLIRGDASLKDTTILLLSASVTEWSQKSGLDVGANEYLMKPFSPRELAARLSELAVELEENQ